jgi:PAS domain S-box-containing protein
MLKTSNDDLAAISCNILQGLADALIFANTKGVIEIWNPGAEFVFGYTASEAVGQSLDLIVPEQLRKAHWEGFQRAIEKGETIHGRRSIVTRSLHKSGGKIYVDMSFAIIKNNAGETVGSVAIARDVTQRHMDDKRLRSLLAAAPPKE